MKISEIITLLIVINYISCTTTITSRARCETSPNTFILNGITSDYFNSDEISVKISSSSIIELQCSLRYKINLEKAKNLFGCNNEENRRINDIDIMIFCTYEGSYSSVITEVKGKGKNDIIIADISNLVETSPINCTTLIEPILTEDRAAIITKVNEGTCSDS